MHTASIALQLVTAATANRALVRRASEEVDSPSSSEEVVEVVPLLATPSSEAAEAATELVVVVLDVVEAEASSDVA
ncbi:uncharacterized protein KRP23_14907 [Phytophthora ramorum]|uniref:uncharacterized protein n=1 Tax=Phytophthora ramorum TaxID=164328 RepID=UPI0030A2B594|nr:hypothetical protein KRP23_14907 [Phytophthora ramorum]